jgi:hypothetical protein
MILETKRLWFKKAVFFLEDNLPSQTELEKKYDVIDILSHTSLSLNDWTLKQKDTAVIDLTHTEEEIFKHMSDTTRNEIRRTYDNPRFTLSQTPDARAVYKLYADFERSRGNKPVGESEIHTFESIGIMFDTELVYGLYLAESLPYIRIRSIFSKRLDVQDKEMIKIISYAGRRLIWESIRDAKKRGFLSYDFASVNRSNPKSEAIARFKLSFGGQVVPEYNYMYRSKMFKIFEKIAGMVK